MVQGRLTPTHRIKKFSRQEVPFGLENEKVISAEQSQHQQDRRISILTMNHHSTSTHRHVPCFQQEKQAVVMRYRQIEQKRNYYILPPI